MVLVQDPTLFLLDEPVAGMTREERERTSELLQWLAKDHAVVVVEHDMEFVRQTAHRVTVLHEGQVLCEGSVEHVKRGSSQSRHLSGLTSLHIFRPSQGQPGLANLIITIE